MKDFPVALVMLTLSLGACVGSVLRGHLVFAAFMGLIALFWAWDLHDELADWLASRREDR